MIDCPASVGRLIQRSTGKNYTTYNSNLVRQYRTYKSSATGKFECDDCDRSWESFKVTIALLFSQDKSRFTIVVYGQQCQRCKSDFFAPTISQNEWKRISDKFRSVLLTTPEPRDSNLQERSQTDATKQHNSELCEACQRNECNNNNQSSNYSRFIYYEF
jgi:hypothetical protein